MKAERDDLHALTGAYALDALDGDERRRFEAHLKTCDACIREIADMQDVALRLSDTTEQLPPAGLRKRILLAASATPQPEHAGAPQVVRLDERRRSAWHWTQRLTAVAAAVLAVAVAGLSYTVANLTTEFAEVESASEQAQRTAEQLVDLLAAPDTEVVTGEGEDGATGRLVASERAGEAVFIVDGLSGAPPERAYQVWLIDEARPRDAGLLAPDVDGRVAHPLAGDIAEAVAIAVTIEPDGGSAQPTSDPILAIELG